LILRYYIRKVAPLNKTVAKTVNAMLAYEIKEGMRLLSKLLPTGSKIK
jgi:hypothetical protein